VIPIPEKLVQKFVNVVCDDIELPRIKVKYKEFISSSDGMGCKACFWPSDFELHYTHDATVNIIFHELVHYIFTIRDTAKGLEELICDMAELGFEGSMKGRKEVLKAIYQIRSVNRYG